MINAIVLTTIILIVIYIFLFRRIRKNREKDFDTISEYHENYIEKKQLYKHHRNSIDNKNYTIYSGDSGNMSNNYVTRYNSNEDYRES